MLELSMFLTKFDNESSLAPSVSGIFEEGAADIGKEERRLG